MGRGRKKLSYNQTQSSSDQSQQAPTVRYTNRTCYSQASPKSAGKFACASGGDFGCFSFSFFTCFILFLRTIFFKLVFFLLYYFVDIVPNCQPIASRHSNQFTKSKNLGKMLLRVNWKCLPPVHCVQLSL